MILMNREETKLGKGAQRDKQLMQHSADLDGIYSSRGSVVDVCRIAGTV